ncbi:MAG: DUF1573 domain-containing protein [Bacteroidales bacterium]|nr:DUF1573 domain-containing protein [Bacteroidales bacterium]
MKRIGLTMLMVVACVIAFAQPKIQFDKTTHDFGKIREEGGKVTGRFEFTNVGNSDLVLTNVRPGCGCTAANYSHDPIAPGQKGFIEATYNPYNRPGAFNKNIRVTTNEPQFTGEKPSSPHMIFIKGEVIKRPPTKFEQAGFTEGAGMSRIKQNNVMHTLKNTESVKDTFKIHNFWNRPVSYELVSNEYVSEVSRSFGKSLMPGEDGTLVLKYDASKRNAFGQLKDIVYIETNDSVEAKKAVYYAVNIKEDFSGLTKKQIKNKPIALYSATTYDFGKVQKNNQQKATITVTNKGKDPLIIRALQSSNGMFKASADILEIPGGREATVTVNFKANTRTSTQKATLEVITNDPINPVQVINMQAQVL